MLSAAERVAFYEAGADPTPVAPRDTKTAEQLWYELLQLPPDQRLVRLRHLLALCDVSYACTRDNHTAELVHQRDRIAVLEALAGGVR